MKQCWQDPSGVLPLAILLKVLHLPPRSPSASEHPIPLTSQSGVKYFLHFVSTPLGALKATEGRGTAGPSRPSTRLANTAGGNAIVLGSRRRLACSRPDSSWRPTGLPPAEAQRPPPQMIEWEWPPRTPTWNSSNSLKFSRPAQSDGSLCCPGCSAPRTICGILLGFT